jgi:hypothetical protein
MITPIPSNFVSQVWPRVSHHVMAAVEYVDSGFNEQDILERLLSRDFQLWIVGQYQAACVTQITIYPQHKVCLVVALGGEGMDEWLDELMDTVEDWAAQNGCRYVEEYGRKGWLKVGKKRGYGEVYTVMRKSI